MSDDRPWHTFDSEGRCIAWLHSLPDGTRYLLADDGRSDARIAPTAPPIVNAFDRPVVVVAWPDGSPPEAPQPELDEWFEVSKGDDPFPVLMPTEEGARAMARDNEAIVHVQRWLTETRTVIRQEVKP